MAENPMEHDTHVRVNWFTINAPTIVALLGLLATGVSVYVGIVNSLDRMAIRLDNMVEARNAAKIDNDKRWDQMNQLVVQLVAQGNKSEFRVTSAEERINAISERQDRMVDAMGDLRDSMAKLNTSFEVLTQRIENAIPMRKSDMMPGGVPGHP